MKLPKVECFAIDHPDAACRIGSAPIGDGVGDGDEDTSDLHGRDLYVARLEGRDKKTQGGPNGRAAFIARLCAQKQVIVGK